MKKLLLLLLAVTSLCGVARGQNATSPPPSALEVARPMEWTTELVNGWKVYEGDDPAFAHPDFDDSGWQPVDMSDLGAAKRGWRWYRARFKLPAQHPQFALLIEGGEGAYELYINGERAPGAELLSTLRVRRPIERVYSLTQVPDNLTIALRTNTPPVYSAWRLYLIMDIVLGTPDAIENQRAVMESVRLYTVLPTIAINLLLMIAGIGVFAMRRSQPQQKEYLWLGLYLFLLGLANLLFGCQESGLAPLSTDFLFSDLILYVATIAQIEFTFSFGGQRVGRLWRVYEAILVLDPILLVLPTWLGYFPSEAYAILEALVMLPAALILPILLFVWYRRGNREAGWLILPSLLPAATVALFDIGTVSIFLGWHPLDFLDNPIPLGPIPLSPIDVGDVLFLLAIGIVIFFRFSRVSREQARTAAELEAAREIQQRLVPASLPVIAGYKIEAVYLPAEEVSGDFYQVLKRSDGSALIVVGDVSGKGLKAAMTGALAIGALRALAAEDPSPGVFLSHLNRQIYQTQNNGFITCLCTRLEHNGSVTMANAGHLPPYRDGKEIAIESDFPLGIAEEVEYAEMRFQLAPGETLTLLSDGVVEARNATGELYGFERTREISVQSARSIAETAQGYGQEDDITVLTLSRMSAGVGD
jgi:hypothetical protein